MSICIDKKAKRYYISYQIKKPDGTYKTFNIKNKEWTLERGKKFMKQIEAEEIERDKAKRDLYNYSDDGITFEKLIDEYMTEKSIELKRQTLYNKKLIIGKYINTHFPITKTLDKALTLSNLDAFKKYLIPLEDINTDRKNRILKLLKEIIEYASDHEYLSYELYRKSKALLKNFRNARIKHSEKLLFWTNEEWDKFYASFEENDPWKLFFKTLYFAGLRIGEGLALRWKHFNPKNNTLLIIDAVGHDGKITTTKTESSEDIVSIPKSLANELIKYKEDMFSTDNDFIFFGYKHTSRTTVRRIMKEHINASGVPFIKVHGLRHSCASRMINAGLSPLIVSKHLRHSSPQETLNTYSHLFPSATIGVIDDVFREETHGQKLEHVI